ncbi:MAG: ATP-dependent sacrificial sulfur transferase LarE [Thermoanaerobaculia bacterium]
MNLIEKEKKLRNYIKNLESCLVALSGGVDSSYLTLIAHQELKDKMLAITADSPSLPGEMKKIVQKFIKKFKIPHIFIKTEEIKDPIYYKNDGLRCYACKRQLFKKMKEIAKKGGFKVIIDGTQGSDLTDERPGRKAAEELKVLSPLILFDFKKEEIRKRAKELGIEQWDLPESACLSSRIIQGEKITVEKLKMVEKGEEFLKKMGFKKLRVRHHNLLARIEVEKGEIERFFDMKLREKVLKFFKKNGFQFVTIDMEGYKRGGGNLRKIIKNNERSGV